MAKLLHFLSIMLDKKQVADRSNVIHQVNIEGVFSTTSHIGFTLGWTATKGYGLLQVMFCDDGVLRIDSEHMSKEFVIEVLKKLVDDAELVD